ncbi:hydroxycarboxylic acid receptor 3-like [Hyperolius riggenbachi]|uniref:hydroxycarboxylic acid receptor 3-like n=1 Tax=Hyperolius riggenbachi TaxID=752182 RepID=UPI0035A34E44
MNSSGYCFFEESELSPTLGILLLVEFALGLIGNGVVLWVFCFRIPVWNTSILYVFNVSLAEFLLIICLPFRAMYYLRGKNWCFGDIPCRIMLFMLSLNRTESIFFLTLVVLNRYFKIVHPHHRINMMKSNPGGLVVTFLLWAFIISLTVYILLSSHLITEEVANTTLCESFNLNWDGSFIIIWHYVFFVIELFIPLLIILVSGPVHTCTSVKNGPDDRTGSGPFAYVLIRLRSGSICTFSTIIVVISKHSRTCQLFDISSLVFAVFLALTYFNSVLNPLAIYISSPSFQTALNTAWNCP